MSIGIRIRRAEVSIRLTFDAGAGNICEQVGGAKLHLDVGKHLSNLGPVILYLIGGSGGAADVVVVVVVLSPPGVSSSHLNATTVPTLNGADAL